MAIREEDVADAQYLVVTGKVRADLVPEGLLAFALENDDVVIRGVITLKEPAGTGICRDRSAPLGENGGCGIIGHHHAWLVLVKPCAEKQLLRFFTDLTKPFRASLCPRTTLVAQSLIVITVLTKSLVPSIDRLDGDVAELLIDFWEKVSRSVREFESGRSLCLRLPGLGAILAPFHHQSKTGHPDGVCPVGDDDIVGCNGHGNGAFGDGPGNLDTRSFGHGRDQPFLSAAATGAGTKLPAFAGGTLLN